MKRGQTTIKATYAKVVCSRFDYRTERDLMKMKVLLIALAMLVMGAGQGKAQAPAEPGKFDFFLLNLSWSPEFCVTHPTNGQCAAKPGFILHGLWGENLDGSFPYHCSSAPGPAHPEAYADVTPDASLIGHEWDAHGTCSGMAPDAYFSLARKAFQTVAIPPELKGLDHEIMLPPSGFLEMFAKANPSFPAGSMVLSCGNNRLTAIEVCMTKGLVPMACPVGIRACRANAVKVTPQQ
jgi:ribonuclease T2